MELLGIDNVFFQVGNIGSAITFYEKLGFRLKFRIPSGALLCIGKEEPGLMLCEKSEPSPSRLWVEVKNALIAKDKFLNEGQLIETATGYTFEMADPWGNLVGFADYIKKPELSRG